MKIIEGMIDSKFGAFSSNDKLLLNTLSASNSSIIKPNFVNTDPT